MTESNSAEIQIVKVFLRQGTRLTVKMINEISNVTRKYYVTFAYEWKIIPKYNKTSYQYMLYKMYTQD